MLSPSTEAYDRGLKFRHYRQIQSLKNNVLSSQDQMQVFTNEGEGRWILTESSGPDGVLQLPALNIDVPLQALYADLNL